MFRDSCLFVFNGSVFLAWLYFAGSLVCHQIPERSFHINGAQLPVCARCTGLYLSALVGALAWMALRQPIATGRARRALLASAVPTLATVASAALGWWDPANAVRALAAAPLGAATGVLVVAGLSGNLR